MSSEQRETRRQPGRSSRSTNGMPLVVPHNSESRNPAGFGLKSESNRLSSDVVDFAFSWRQPSVQRPCAIRQAIEHPGVARCLNELSRSPRLKVSDLGIIAGLSLRGLNRAFRTHLGCTPGAVMIRVRLWNVCDLLANSRLPIAKIATLCGYRNSNSLYVALRRYLGTTPLRIRRQSALCDHRDANWEHARRLASPPPLFANNISNL
jgi:AraC-like DNA-binding protein